MKIVAKAKMPPQFLQEYVQHLRDYEQRHCEVEITLKVEASELSAEAVNETLDLIEPPFVYRTTIAGQKGGHLRTRIRG
jgi:hypothetical protein